MTARELRQKYLDFFKLKGHTIIPSASLIPENDPTVLFTTAGMHPLVPYLLGEKHPGGSRVTSVQKCIRTNDIEEVGDRTHHTFFEMLGNWSFGSYFKEDAIKWSWEFLTSPEGLNLDKNRIAVSVFAGDNDAPFDNEAFAIWKNLGVPENRIAKLPKKNNWWGLDKGGPCGPDTEIFYWAGNSKEIPDSFNDDNELWIEIWNNVFMEYFKKEDGSFEQLKQKNVDTGMGMERVLAVLNGFDDNYKTDLFAHLIHKIETLTQKKYDESTEIKKAMRIIADHLKAATFIMGDDKGIAPSNTDQGYIVRRLIRRAIRYGNLLGIIEDGVCLAKNEPWTKEIAKIVIHDYMREYPELEKNANFIINNLKEEENKFKKTLEKGEKFFSASISPSPSPSPEIFNDRVITGENAFNLYQTYGFPIEMTEELARNKGIKVDIDGFKKELEKHQELSRTASVGKFKGGLADAGQATVKLHTAAHLLLAALRKVLGDHVTQKGSNITAERLRFDFAQPEKLTTEQITEVERLVNEAIRKKLPISCEEMNLDEAKDNGAMGVFESKYGEHVKVYTIGEGDNIVSKEICGGPHVENTDELGNFKIIKEESSSSGVRRIKAILE
jgi:alanyl-tRNA synthetase